MHNIELGLLNIAIGFSLLAFFIILYSIVRFSSILVKLVVLEMLTNLLMAGIAIWALITRQPIFIDVCLTLALIMFLAVVAYYQFLFKKERSDADINW